MPLKLLLLGTGEFARPAFAALADGPHEIVGLVTQPDRGGPGHHNHPHPVKEEFLERGVPVLQPTDVNTPETLDRLATLDADLAVVAAYGQILRPELLTTLRLGAVNLHASLLPRHRGATPIHHAILAGDTRTGVSIFQIEPTVDTGPLLGTVCTTIADNETTGELHDRLAKLAAGLAVDVVERLASGTTQPLDQDDSLATRAPRLTKSDAAIDWSCDAATLDRHVRAMQPWPNPFTFLHATDAPPRRLIILAVEAGPRLDDIPPGTIVTDDDHDGLVIGCGGGTVRVTRLQPEGRRLMEAETFLRGTVLGPGAHLGPLGQPDA